MTSIPFGSLIMNRWSNLWQLQSKMWNPENAGETRQAVSFHFPLENYLLERRNWLRASVFFSLVSLKEGDLGLLSKRRFQDRNVDRRIGGVQQSSGLIVFGIVHVHFAVTATRGWGRGLMMTQEIPWHLKNKGQSLKRSQSGQNSCTRLSSSLLWSWYHIVFLMSGHLYISHSVKGHYREYFK